MGFDCDSSTEASARGRRVAESPLIIVGAPRSGTTWLQRLLLSDARCCGGQESHFFVSFGRVLRDFDRKAGLERPHGLACYWRREDLLAEIRELWARTMRRCIEDHPHAEVLVEKTPDHALWIDELDQLLPAARFIHLVRDSRAVCASLLFASRQSWGRTWAPRSVAAAAEKWLSHVEAAERSGARLGRRFLRLHYEELHSDPVAALQRVYRFAELTSKAEALADIVARNSFVAQAEEGGTPFQSYGEFEGQSPREPDGFFRSGSADAWRRELGFWRKRAIWRRTRRQMHALGYSWSGY